MTTLADLYLARLRELGHNGYSANLVAFVMKSKAELRHVRSWMEAQPALVRLVGAWVR